MRRSGIFAPVEGAGVSLDFKHNPNTYFRVSSSGVPELIALAPVAQAFTAADLLTMLLGVDGAGSLLDADKLDGASFGSPHPIGDMVPNTGQFTTLSVTGSLGYVPGAGGAITQQSNKSTAVTLNKLTGQITLNNAALNDAAKVSFTVNNLAVAATDTVIINHANTGTAGGYQIQATAVAAGSFKVTVRNISGGPLSEAIVLNFAVIKAVAA
jgi:hypothetical protein